MPKYTKGTSRKSYATKKKQPLALSTQVKKIITKMSETKLFTPGFTSYANLTPNIFQAWNLLYWIQTGTSNNQKLGDEIFIKAIDIGITIRKPANASTSSVDYSGGGSLCVMLIKSQYQNYDGTLGPAPAGFSFPDFRAGGSGSVANPIVDPAKVTVLYRKDIALQPSYQAPAIYAAPVHGNTFSYEININHTVNVNRKFQYTTTTSGYEKSMNMYLVVGHSNPAALNGLFEIVPNYCVRFGDF